MQNFLKNNKAVFGLITGILMPLIVGFLALSINEAVWYVHYSKYQNAALSCAESADFVWATTQNPSYSAVYAAGEQAIAASAPDLKTYALQIDTTGARLTCVLSTDLQSYVFPRDLHVKISESAQAVPVQISQNQQFMRIYGVTTP